MAIPLVTCTDPRTGQIVRWRCHEANVQRAVKAAAAPLGLDITPHHLRHAYATHCLNAGTNVRAIQEVMGHKYLETTQGYLHADALSVRSPLDAVSAIDH
jgi:integrase/recombinase XerC